MPFSAGVVQEAGVPLRPAISTRHSRQEPKGSSQSVAQSLGTWMPASDAARMMDVPAGTVTECPSISSVTCCVAFALGRAAVDHAQVDFGMHSHGWPLSGRLSLGRGAMRRTTVEIFGKMLHCADHRHGGQPAECAKRAVAHGLAKIAAPDRCSRTTLSPRMILSMVSAPRRANRCGRACICRRIRWRRNGRQNAPVWPDRRCRRTPRCRHGRPCRPWPRMLRNRAAHRTGSPANRRQAVRPPAPREPGVPNRCRRHNS